MSTPPPWLSKSWKVQKVKRKRNIKGLLATPRWKAKREWRRLKAQVADALMLADWWDPLRAAAWRRIWFQRANRSDGDIKPGRDIAIYLIFPSNGCPESLLQSLDHLVENGFAPLIVSNVALQAVDRDILRSRAFLIVERANVGYDFGGYRDAVLILREAGLIPDNLLFINDSIWFPVRPECDLLERMRAAPEAYVGCTDSFYYGMRGLKESALIGHLHITSFMFMVKRSAIESDAFQQFWEHYKLPSKKAYVVRWGEVGFFDCLAGAGVSHRAIFSKKDILAHLRAVGDDEIEAVMERLIGLTPDAVHTWAELLRRRVAGEDVASSTRDFVLHQIELVNTSDCLAYEGVRRFEFPFVKKAILRNGSHAQAERFRYYVEKDGVNLDPVVMREIGEISKAKD